MDGGSSLILSSSDVATIVITGVVREGGRGEVREREKGRVCKRGRERGRGGERKQNIKADF